MGEGLGKLSDDLPGTAKIPAKLVVYNSVLAKHNAIIYMSGEVPGKPKQSYKLGTSWRAKQFSHKADLRIGLEGAWTKPDVWGSFRLYWSRKQGVRDVLAHRANRIRRQMKPDVVHSNPSRPFRVWHEAASQKVFGTVDRGMRVLPWQDPEFRLFDVGVPHGYTGETEPPVE